MMKPSILAAFIILCACLRNLPPHSNVPRSSESNSNTNWTLIWSDEFNGANSAPPDQTKWIIESGGTGWGNNEMEYYTSRGQNIRQENGHLVIQAIKDSFTGPDGVRRNYTSGRIKTAGRFSQQYGRFEARIKIPRGQGLWPAFWLLGDDLSTVGWPACGEIDIMENAGQNTSKISAALHGPGYSGRNALVSSYLLPRGRLSDNFHVFALEWEPYALRFYVDAQIYATKTPADLPSGKRWVYDHPFFIILNLAVGGDLPGSPDRSTVFPQRMLVDYVRVYLHK